MKVFQTTILLLFIAFSLFAGVIKESQSTIKFKGALGVAMRLMSNMDEPQKKLEYYSANASRIDDFEADGTLTSSSIVDAERGAIIGLDHKAKTYTEMTFSDMEKMMSSGAAEMEAAEAEMDQEGTDEAQVDVTYKVDVQKQGKETVNGFNAVKYLVRIDIEAKATGESDGEQVEATQPMVVNSTVWAVQNLKAAKEMQKYQEAMAKKMAKNFWGTDTEEMSASLSSSNPELISAMQAMQKEMDKIEGTIIKNNISYEVLEGTSNQPAKKEKQEIPTSVGGLLGGLSKKVAKSIEKSMESDVLMESTEETLKLAIENFDSSVFKIPADYKKIEMNFDF